MEAFKGGLIMGKFIDKSALNVNRTTNATGLLSAIAALGAVFEGISHDRPVWEWLPMFALGVSNAIAQWLQGTPSTQTKAIARLLNLEGDTNADLGISLVRRVADSGPAHDRGVVDVSRNEPTQSDRMAGLDTRLWVAPPENLSPGEAKAAAWRAASIVRGQEPIEGTNVYGAEYAALSQSATEDEDGPQSEAWERRF